ncbi:M56 family metallopeptidase [Tenacibaculum sp. SG-28]|uniref:M56 family metallopeptidase n=1 Tax=Tenacibaculum sp. SG-28 TaxID=754426 RepID=UPI000CF55328|nr:M56 family metallopeptidase [Tenacibaculum sp. SG-28]PQJ21150.1 hypothetical protein BSU00_09125 [Tenacibaculum sp. SG-28]
MVDYCIQVILFQIIFLLVYDVFLCRETFFKKNRIYLLATAMASFILPKMQFSVLRESVNPEFYVLLPDIIISPQAAIEKKEWYASFSTLDTIIAIGCFVFLVIFILKLGKIGWLVYKNRSITKANYHLVVLPNTTKAFSFFNFIFIGSLIAKSKQQEIVQHEIVHVNQKHTIDLLFFELLRIVMWFNPMVYLYQKRITLVHEYLTDAEVGKTMEKDNYISTLLADVFQVENISFTNQFYKQSLLKKRIIMIKKNHSKKAKQLKYLFLVPALIAMLFYTSCSNEAEVESSISEKEQIKLYNGDKREPITIKEVSSHFDVNSSYDNQILGTEIDYASLSAEVKESIKMLFKKGIIHDGEVKFSEYNGRKIINIFPATPPSSKSTVMQIEEVPFSKLDKYPTFPGCPEGDKDCLQKSFNTFVKNNFDATMADNLGLKAGRTRILATFRIGKNGMITDLKVRAPHEKLKEHTMQILQQLPKTLPGEKDGKIVETSYTLPIRFEVK